MKTFIFLLSLLSVSATLSYSAPVLIGEGNRVIVPQGDYVAGGRAVPVSKGVSLTLAPAISILVEDEPHKLTSDKPNRWAGGTHLDKPKAGGTSLPGCVVPGSVVVKLPDGSVATRDKDYFLDENWAGLSRLEGGRIPEGGEVKITYRMGLMRIDTIEVNPAGDVTLHAGKAEITTPEPPPVSDGSIALAHIFMPYNASTVEPWQIFEIGPVFPEPDDAEMARRSKLVEKTLAKLRAGEPVTIVTWGDSVTVGGDASTEDKRFANQFIIRLRERFPKSNITHINAGIGGTSTSGRLPGLGKDVIEHKPDLVTIEFVNDMGIPEDVLKNNYKSAFDQIRAAGAEIILITPHFTLPEWMNHPHPRGKETRATVEQLRKRASDFNVALADTSKRWEHLEIEGLPYTTLLENGINHPDDRGHELFVKDLLTFFPAK